ncbi:hypothetical protein B0H67DRAFT_271422 [Lasiosphaeris hirsuta]|uniref:Uncharacterized protein n=1 Tax=Lasiosphaeris hirsuta TaxID=260670 RepID=A0AA40A823_9PEZI|nr:hypothetical protein B0H67DRAFT_271422 [Lasiosphaeris hirsuta]
MYGNLHAPLYAVEVRLDPRAARLTKAAPSDARTSPSGSTQPPSASRIELAPARPRAQGRLFIATARHRTEPGVSCRRPAMPAANGPSPNMPQTDLANSSD